MRRSLLILIVAVICLPGCDPCAGVAQCTNAPRLAIEGTLVTHISGTPEVGARIDVVRTGGVALERDSLTAYTDAQGHWSVATAANGGGDVIVDVNVQSTFGAYRVQGVHVATTDRRGDGTVLPPWVADPHFNYAAEIRYRGLEDIRVADVPVRFVRTAGIPFYVGTDQTTFDASTSANGRVPLFDLFAHSPTTGELIGDLIVYLPAPFATDTIHGIRLESSYLLQVPAQVIVMEAGPSLLYVVELHERSNDKPAANVHVTFQRVAGPATSSPSFSATTDVNGRFVIPVRALGDGVLTANLNVVPQLGTPFTTRLTLPTFHEDQARFYGVINVGPALPWVGLVQDGPTGVPGIAAEFHRTGGILVEPSDYTAQSDANGYVPLNPQPLDTGFVEADIVLRPPAPFDIIRSHVRLHTVEDDKTGGLAVQWLLQRTTP